MALLPKIKLKTLPTFPSVINGGTGIDVTKLNGALTVDLDYSRFGEISAIPTTPTSNVLTYDTTTKAYVMLPAHLLGGGVSGIADAPNDGVQYGRQNVGGSNTWTPVVSTGGGGIPEAPTDGAIYARDGQTTSWVQALPSANPNLIGILSVNGVATLSGSSNYTVLYSGKGVPSLFLGGLTDQTNYYRNSAHYFQSLDASTIFFTANAANVNFTNIPTAPTTTPYTDSSTKLATTAFVQSALAANSVPAASTAGYLLQTNGTGSVPTWSGFLQAGAGAVTRTWLDKARDPLSVKDFGAVGNGIADDTNAIKACIAAAIPNGAMVRIPRGVYIISSTLTIGNSGAGTVGSAQSITQRTGIIGDGAAASILQWTGGGSTCIHIITGGESLSHFSDFSVLQPSSTKAGFGIFVEQTSHATFSNITATGFDEGFRTVDCFTLSFIRCFFSRNNYGIVSDYSTVSHPNDFNFYACNFSNNFTVGAQFNSPTTLTFTGGSFENNGQSAPWNGGINISGNPIDGSAGFNISGAYFEANVGSSDIMIQDANGNGGIHNIHNCTFNRISNAGFTSANVALYKSTGAKSILTISGNGFSSFGSYVPDASRVYIQVLSSAGTNYHVDMGSNYYASTVETPGGFP